ncbi:uncharacterized protein [Gossypium hirsutum]|uniref:Uncharacterized protein isoform X4 n=1 Tax=Gossypium hirsutum TaxID=3635 RepID=A0ABM3AQH3_GOSHI|nr:uncharacterized protein LOC107890880 isoform X4 [Gossypium hirsutum]
MMIHTCVALRPCRPPLISSSKSTLQRPPNCKFSVRNCIRDPNNSQKKWRQEFGVADLSEDTVKSIAKTGKAYVHDFLDVNDRPVLIVVASKHLPDVHDPRDNEKLCVFLIEKALSKLPAGQEQILGIVDLRGFGTKNADLSYLTFLVIYKLVAEHCWELGHCICLPGTKNADLSYLTFLLDVFYYYYPKRLGEVLFVEAPFVFQPMWQLTKPLLKSYASMVKFCSTETVRKEYFTEETLPISFRD